MKNNDFILFVIIYNNFYFIDKFKILKIYKLF